jgi:adenosylhomocysteinase
LAALGAEVKWILVTFFNARPGGRCNSAETGFGVFAWKGQTQAESDWCSEQTLFFGADKPLNMILDDGGDLTGFLINILG